MFEFEKETVLWSKDDLEVLLWQLLGVKGQLEVTENCSNCRFHLVHGKLLPYAVPRGLINTAVREGLNNQ